MSAGSRDVRICFFGDSFTNGTLDSDYLSWTGRLCATLPLQVTHYNLGIRGNTALDIEQRWEAESQRRWKVTAERRLVFAFGTNDCVLEEGRPRLPLPESVASAERLLTRALACCPTLFLGPPAVELEERNASYARLEQLSQAYAALAVRVGVPYLDLFGRTRDSRAWREAVERGDGTHPQPSGYALLAGLVQEWDAWRAWW